MKFLVTMEITVNAEEWNDTLEIRRRDGMEPSMGDEPITDARDVATEFGLGLKTAFAPEMLEDRIWYGNENLNRCLGDLVMVSVNSCDVKAIEG